MATFKCIRGVVTSKGPVAIGDTVEGLPEFETRMLMSQGKLVPHDATEIRTTEDTEVVHRDPAPARRGRPRKF